MIKLIEDKPHCTIEYDPAAKCVFQTWKGYATSKNFRASLEKTVEVFMTHDATSIISNTQNSKVVDEADAHWVAQDMNPILIQHGLRKIAFVVPENLLARWSIDHFFEDVKDQLLAACMFDNVDKAKAWIAEAQ